MLLLRKFGMYTKAQPVVVFKITSKFVHYELFDRRLTKVYTFFRPQWSSLISKGEGLSVFCTGLLSGFLSFSLACLCRLSSSRLLCRIFTERSPHPSAVRTIFRTSCFFVTSYSLFSLSQLEIRKVLGLILPVASRARLFTLSRSAAGSSFFSISSPCVITVTMVITESTKKSAWRK